MFIDLPATAHEIRPAIATFGINADGRAELTVSLNLEAALAEIGSGHQDTAESVAAPDYNRLRTLSAAGLSAKFMKFIPSLKNRIVLKLNGRPLVFDAIRVEIPETGDTALARISIITLGASFPDRPRSFSWRFDPALGDSVIRLRNAESEKIIHAEYVRAGQTAGPFALADLVPQSWTQLFTVYLKIGFVHIVPKGLDHILFVLGLFLLSTRLSALLWQVSAFTVGHTMALALSASGVVTVSSAIVEPLIAASIVYVGVENVFTSRLHRWRPLVVFGFGLLHGLGFASVLGEVGLAPGHFLASLLAFNLGVELGQLAVIMTAFLVIGWAAHRTWYRRVISIPASLAIALVAGVWVVQRLGLM